MGTNKTPTRRKQNTYGVIIQGMGIVGRYNAIQMHHKSHGTETDHNA